MSSESAAAEAFLKKLKKLDSNKTCADCPETAKFGFGSVSCVYKTFVCNYCKSAHQSFSHRIKSISMSHFTKKEAASMSPKRGGGNIAARRVWLGKMTKADKERYMPKKGDSLVKFKKWIHMVYEDKKFYKKPSKHPAPAAKKKPAVVKAPKPAPAAAPADDLFSFGAPAPAAQPAAADDSFAGLFGGGSTPAPAPASGFNFSAPAPAPTSTLTGFNFSAPAPAPAASNDLFSSFGAPTPAPAPAASNDLFSGFGNLSMSQPTATQQPRAPAAAASAISMLGRQQQQPRQAWGMAPASYGYQQPTAPAAYGGGMMGSSAGFTGMGGASASGAGGAYGAVPPSRSAFAQYNVSASASAAPAPAPKAPTSAKKATNQKTSLDTLDIFSGF